MPCSDEWIDGAGAITDNVPGPFGGLSRSLLPEERSQKARTRGNTEHVACHECHGHHAHALRFTRDPSAHFVSARVVCREDLGFHQGCAMYTFHTHPRAVRVWHCQRLGFGPPCRWCTGPLGPLVEWWARRKPHPTEDARAHS